MSFYGRKVANKLAVSDTPFSICLERTFYGLLDMIFIYPVMFFFSNAEGVLCVTRFTAAQF